MAMAETRALARRLTVATGAATEIGRAGAGAALNQSFMRRQRRITMMIREIMRYRPAAFVLLGALVAAVPAPAAAATAAEVVCAGGVDRTTRILATRVAAMSAEAARHITIGMKCTEAIATLAAQGFVVAVSLDCPAEIFMEAPSGRFCYAILFTAPS